MAPAEVVSAAAHHRVTPAVWRFASITDAPADHLAALAPSYDDQVVRHLTVAGDLEWLADVLGHASVPWLVMKGPVLADVLWPRPDMREYYDLDVLVAPDRFGVAIDALVGAGAQLIDRNWPLIARQLRGELTLVLPFGTPLDLHWDLVNHDDVRREFALRTGDLLARRRTVTLGGSRYPTFAPTDMLLSVALHAAHAGATRLVWLKDVERAAAVDALDWRDVDRRARVTGLHLLLTVLLSRSWRTLGCRPPAAGWFADRAPLPWVAQVLDRTIPVGSAPPGTAHSGQLLYRSLRPSTAGTVRAAYTALVHPPPSLGAGGDNPLHRDVPDDRAQADYLRAVRQTA